MARPKAGQEKHRSESVRFRITRELRADLERVAAAHGRQMSDTAVDALAIGLKWLETKKPAAERAGE